MPIKIHQLAKEMQVQSKDIISLCLQNKIDVKSAQSIIPDDALPVVRQLIEMQFQLGSIRKEVHKPAKKKPPAPKKKPAEPAAEQAGTAISVETAAEVTVDNASAVVQAPPAEATAAPAAAEQADAPASAVQAQQGADLPPSSRPGLQIIPPPPVRPLDPAEIAELRRKKKKKKKKDRSGETADGKPAIEIHFQRAGEADSQKLPEGLFTVVGQVELPEAEPVKAPPLIPTDEDEEDEKAARVRALLTRLGRNWEDLPGIQKVRSLSGPPQRQQAATAHRRRRSKRRKVARDLNQSPFRGKKVVLYPPVTPRSLAEALGVQLPIIQARFLSLGKEPLPDEPLTDETANMLAMSFEVEFEIRRKESAQELVNRLLSEPDPPDKMKPRPPVVTVMGHVDHGKTTLLDTIRNTNVAAGEYGGITQHIRAYSVQAKGHTITFLDTPGHEAFTEMRSRGAKITDIVVLVVAADDGVMPQTEEAIQHARQAKVPIVVAINKTDISGANIDRIKQQLSQHNLIPEDWGGDTLMVPVSALKGVGIDKLLENILLQAEMMELKAAVERPAQGYVLEARQSDAQGPLVDVLVTRGTLRPGASIIAGSVAGRVRALVDWHNQPMKEAGPGTPTRVFGFTDVPQAGAAVIEFESIDRAREIAAEIARAKTQAADSIAAQPLTLETLTARLEENAKPELKVILKTDVRGSMEAVLREIDKVRQLTTDAKIDILHTGVGAISVSDVLLAATGGAIILAFNVGTEGRARQEAEGKGVEIRTYRIIYELAEDLRKALEGLLAPEEHHLTIGHAEVRQVFDISRVGKIAGCMVTDGRIERRGRARVLRQGRIVHDAPIADLKRFKEDVREVREGFDCGIRVHGYDDVTVGDVIEVYVVERVEKKL